MAKILIPTALRQFTDQKDAVDVSGATVGEALTSLTAQYPNLRKNLFNDAGKLRSFVNVYVNDEDIRYLEKTETKVSGDTTLSIVPSIAGGSTAVAEPVDAAATSLTQRRDRALQPALDSVRSRHGRTAQAEECQNRDGWRGRPGRTARACISRLRASDASASSISMWSMLPTCSAR